jgi:hypothetical protein
MTRIHFLEGTVFVFLYHKNWFWTHSASYPIDTRDFSLEEEFQSLKLTAHLQIVFKVRMCVWSFTSMPFMCLYGVVLRHGQLSICHHSAYSRVQK